jgi:hypothetical protein
LCFRGLPALLLAGLSYRKQKNIQRTDQSQKLGAVFPRKIFFEYQRTINLVPGLHQTEGLLDNRMILVIK